MNFVAVGNGSLLSRLGNFTGHIVDMQVYWSVLDFHLPLETHYLEGIDDDSDSFIFFKAT